MVTSAKYGRMKIGKCVPRSFGRYSLHIVPCIAQQVALHEFRTLQYMIFDKQNLLHLKYLCSVITKRMWPVLKEPKFVTTNATTATTNV